MKETIKNLVFVTIPALLIVFLICEGIFRFIIPAAEKPRVYFDTDMSMYFFIPNQMGTYTIGKFAQQKGKWRINNYGWNSPIDYATEKKRPLIAVIGDSYVEALQVDVDKSFPYVLKNKLANSYDVYTFGRSGYPLSQYLYTSRYVTKKFKPDILIFNIVHNDFDESVRECNGSSNMFHVLSIDNDEITWHAPRLRNQNFTLTRSSVRQPIALKRYIANNLKFGNRIKQWTAYNTCKEFKENIDINNIKKRKNEIFKVTRYVVQNIRKENEGVKIVFIFDGPCEAIYNGSVINDEIKWLHDLIKKLCGQNDIYLLDMTEPMTQDYKKNHVKFSFDFDNHLNKYGHKFVADTLYKFLEQKEIIQDIKQDF